MRVLLDTCVLSELKRARGSSAVRQAVQAIDSDNLYVSVISVGEIANGVALLDDGQRKRDLQAWLEALEPRYSERILGVDLETARIWGEMTAAPLRANDNETTTCREFNLEDIGQTDDGHAPYH